jgi:hypothetical protein
LGKGGLVQEAAYLLSFGFGAGLSGQQISEGLWTGFASGQQRHQSACDEVGKRDFDIL